MPNWLWNFLYGNFFHVFFFKLFTNDTFTNKDKLLKLVSTKKIKKRIFSKKNCSKIWKFEHFETLKPPQKLNFQLFSTFIFYKSLFRCLLLFWKNELIKKCFLLFYFRKTAENELFSRFSRKLGELHVRFCFWPKIRIQRYKKIQNPSKHLWDQKLT